MPTELQHRRLQAEDAAIPISAGDRTAEVIFTTGAAVPRRDWMTGERYLEVLSLELGHVRMERLVRGAPLLAVHNQYELDAVIGVTESASLTKGKGTARVRFAKTPEGDKALALVKDRILRNVSVGYIVHRYQKTDAEAEGGLPTWLAIDWEPAEISMVPVPADPGAQVRGAPLETALDSPPNQRKEMTMPHGVTPAASGPAGRESDEQYTARIANLTEGPERRAEILERTMRAGLDHTFAQRLIESKLPFESVCARIVDEVARRHDYSAISGVRTDGAANRHSPREAMAGALFARYGGERPTALAQPYVGRRMVDHGRELLEINGIRTTGMAPQEIIQRAMMSTSDFPGLLEDVANKFLRKGYAAYTGGVRVIARRGPDAPDFKALKKLQLGEAPTLSKVLEGGEVKRGKMAEMKESYSVESFAKIIPLSLQALVNDDLNAFTQLSQKWGRAAAEFECTQLATLLTSNPTMGSDSTALFHANHGNLAGSGGAISVTTLGAAKLAMRKQKDIGGVAAIDVTPRYLVVPAALEVVALQYITQITPAQSSNVNPFQNQLEVVVDPRLDASSATAWYLAADSATIDTLEYSYLEGSNGLQLETQRGWDTLGMEMRAVLHYGCGVLDYRGLYKNPGA